MPLRPLKHIICIEEMNRTANRTITKRVRLTPEEAAELESKAEACGLTQSMLIRQLIKGYRPKEKPDEK